MSKVPYTIDINRYICHELESVRKMFDTHDFSMLPALVERVQFHAQSMEDALYRYEGIKYKLTNIVSREDVTDEDFRKTAKDILDELKK